LAWPRWCSDVATSAELVHDPRRDELEMV
jgi:hypothetical protein